MKTKRINSSSSYHISTDEVFGSLGEEGKFNEDTSYDQGVYSASASVII